MNLDLDVYLVNKIISTSNKNGKQINRHRNNKRLKLTRLTNKQLRCY